MESLRWTLLALILMTLGIAYVVVGIISCAKRSMVQRTRFYFVLWTLPISFYLLFMVTDIIIVKFNLFEFYYILVTLIFYFCVFCTNTFKYGLSMYNITKDDLYSRVLSVFKQLDIEYDIRNEKRYSKLILRNIDASMTIHFSKIGSSLKFTKPKNIPSLNILIRELQSSLRGREFNKIPILGILSIIMGVALLIQGSGILFITFNFFRFFI